MTYQPRHRARETALQVLYRYECADPAFAGPPKLEATQARLISDELTRHFEHFEVAQPLREFVAELVAGTLRQLPQLDALIEKHAVNWKVSRMAAIDRTILRMATFEMRQFPDIAYSITLDEAIELSKQYGTAESPAFINGVLDSIRKTLPEKSAAATESPSKK